MDIVPLATSLSLSPALTPPPSLGKTKVANRNLCFAGPAVVPVPYTLQPNSCTSCSHNISVYLRQGKFFVCTGLGGRKHIQQHRAGLQQRNSVLEPPMLSPVRVFAPNDTAMYTQLVYMYSI